MKLRKEFDSIGSINVPNDKYWGASTQRSKKYFDIGEFLVRPILIHRYIYRTNAVIFFSEFHILVLRVYLYIYTLNNNKII